MKSFQQKRGFRNIINSRPVLVFLGILVLIFAWGVVGFMGKMQITIENRKTVENKMAELRKEKDKLSSDISKLKTESGVEESIRDKFGLAKEGEGKIIVIEDKNPPEVPKQEPRGFFSFFTNLFK
ncbi:MAG: septum formation initiator family protein [Patescibacteria group bacterium]